FDQARDHFGYRDRLTQPPIEGTGIEPTPGSGPPIKAGEFILGYADEDGPPRINSTALIGGPEPGVGSIPVPSKSWRIYPWLRRRRWPACGIAAARNSLSERDLHGLSPIAGACWRLSGVPA